METLEALYLGEGCFVDVMSGKRLKVRNLLRR